ncbi:MAG TPA: ATP-binding protein, partial [Candidatus Deferrimicrobium sp.]
HKSGHFVVIESSGAPFFDAEGVFRGYHGVDRDVGDRKRAQEMLKVSEERFRQLFEQNEEPQFLFRSGTSEILDVNTAVERVYGFSRDELLKEGVALFVPPEGTQEFNNAICGIQPGIGLSVERTTHVRKDGIRIIVSIRGKLIRLPTGHVACCSFRDITVRVGMEEAAKLHQAQLIHANRMASLGRIVSGVAHEVNNPNNLIMFNAPMILSAWDDAVPVLESYFRENGDFSLGGLPYSEMREVVPRLAQGISDASLRIKGIVANLKDFSRQDRAKGHAPVQINDVVRTAIAILNHEIIKATHRFDVELGEGIPPVSGSSQELEQVVINLMNNALQALPSSRHGLAVKTLWNAASGEIEVHVADEGVGMTPDVLERISEPFFSTRLESGGLGLGLSISRSIVKEHRGTLAFESDAGKGTLAIVRLPVIGDAATPGAVSPADPRMNVGG